MRLETEWLDITRVEIPIKNLGSGLDGFRIALISDFHLYPNTRLEFINTVIDEAILLKPDLVALTGDFVQGDADAMDRWGIAYAVNLGGGWGKQLDPIWAKCGELEISRYRSFPAWNPGGRKFLWDLPKPDLWFWIISN